MHRHDDDHAAFLDLHVEGRARLGHLRGLDGLRGLAVAGVVAFHAGFDRMVGGYLGVSTFFTLSGFLIASLLFAGATDADGIVLRGFWGRRVRRLYPASVTTLLLVLVLFVPFVATADQLASMRGDVLAALANVANWRFIAQGSSYADLFSAPSPVLHFWSLAIEEQFYFVFPVLLWGAVKLLGGRRGVIGGLLGALAAGSVAWTLFGGLSDDHIYFGTGTRAAELLLGGVLAVVLTKRSVRRRLAMQLRWRTVALTFGAVALLVQLWLWWTLEQSTWWLYRGGFAAYAALTCAVIVAAAIPGGPVFRALSVGPLRWLGARSYAIYLVHWPLFLVFRQTWGDANRWLITAAVVAISLLLAELSFRVLERPVRLGQLFRTRRRALAALGFSALAVVLLAFTVVPNDPVDTRPDLDAELDQYQELLGAGARPAVRDGETAKGDEEATSAEAENDPTAPSAEAVTAPPPVPVVAVYGDSTALGMGLGLAQWEQATGRVGSVVGDLRFGCGVPRYTSLRAETTVTPTAECVAWPQRWSEVIAATTPDVVLLSSPAWTVPDARIPGADSYSSIGDPAVDDFVRQEFLDAVDSLSSRGALVLLVNWPPYGNWYDDGRADAVRRQADPARMARLHEIQREVVAQRPGQAEVIDLAGWLGERAQDPTLRTDGMHFTADEFATVATDWFGPEVERLWQERWAALQSLEASRIADWQAGISGQDAPRKREGAASESASDG